MSDEVFATIDRADHETIRSALTDARRRSHSLLANHARERVDSTRKLGEGECATCRLPTLHVFCNDDCADVRRRKLAEYQALLNKLND